MRRLRAEDGGSLVLALACISLLGVFAASALAFVGVGSQSGLVARARTAQLYAADAAMEHGIQALVADGALCADSGETHTWPTMTLNGRTVVAACDWIGGDEGDRRVRLVARATGDDGTGATTISATVQPDAGPVVQDWTVRGDWVSPGPSTTTTTTPPPTTTTSTTPTPPSTTPSPPSTTPGPSTTTTTTIPVLSGPLFLKTDGPGDRTSSTPLPLDTTAPTASTVPNYDTDRDDAPGLVVQRGPTNPNGGNTTRFQEWSMPITSATRIQGDVGLELWSSMANFVTGKRGEVTAYLRDCNKNGSQCTDITASIDRRNWNGSTSGWVADTFQFGAVDHSVQAGRTLVVRVMVANRSADDMWFAYDTTAHPSRITFG